MNNILIIFIVAFFLMGSDSLYASFAKAQKMYRSGDYTNAVPLFFQEYQNAKSREIKVKSEWAIAQSLQRMNLFYSASKFYSLIVRRGRSEQNPFFRKALEELGFINNEISLGQAHIVQLFTTPIEPSWIPGAARGFYFHYRGVEAFRSKKYQAAQDMFRLVSSDSSYYQPSQFHLGVIANLAGRHDEAITYFTEVRNSASGNANGQKLREQANLNMARVYYEQRQYTNAIKYYASIPRESSNWLQALFEASWAFFLMKKHNNSLGNIHTIHSPFFNDRFFPESYILQAINFLRLCRYDRVKETLANFKKRYDPVIKDISQANSEFSQNPRGLFRVVYQFKNSQLKRYKNASPMFDALSRTDAYQEAGATVKFTDNELSILTKAPPRWRTSGIYDDLKGFLEAKKDAAIADAGARFVEMGRGFNTYLAELSEQSKLINAEVLLGKVDAMRAKLNIGVPERKQNFIGGMQPLNLRQELEYWPFEGEYWEDELGGYVYNIDSKCPNKGQADKD